MRAQIDTHFEMHRLWSESQFGFRSKRNTEMAVLKFTEIVSESLERREHCVGEFIDLTKAFDCIPHDLLLKKIMAYNFDTSAVQLLSSYLLGRTQRVINGRNTSNPLTVLTGVPQGSILGPTLFLIYINDLPAYVSDNSICLYADDTTILACGPTKVEAIETAHALRELAAQWFCANRLQVNTAKSNSMVFGSRNPTDADQRNTVGFLGIELDATLSWNGHCEATARKISKTLYLLRRLQGSVSLNTIITCYFGLIHSRIKYGILVWGHASKGMKIIFKEQRRAIRIIAKKSPRQDCRRCFVDLNIPTAPSIYILECLLMAHGNQRFTKSSDVHYYDTRQKEDLRTNFCRLKKVQNSANYWAPKLFNTLPHHVRTMERKTFKKTVGNFLRAHSFYSLEEFLCCDMDF